MAAAVAAATKTTCGRPAKTRTFPHRAAPNTACHLDLNGAPNFALQAFGRAMKDWSETLDLNFELTTDPTAAHCRVGFSPLTGTTLAWSHLANGTCSRSMRQEYDIRQWSQHLLYLTVLHELGHLLGLPHRNGPYIMNPSILTDLEGLTERDNRDALNLGYKRAGQAPPAPSPEPAPNELTDAEIDRVIERIREKGGLGEPGPPGPPGKDGQDGQDGKAGRGLDEPTLKLAIWACENFSPWGWAYRSGLADIAAQLRRLLR